LERQRLGGIAHRDARPDGAPLSGAYGRAEHGGDEPVVAAISANPDISHPSVSV
jgi:hypothetical protein